MEHTSKRRKAQGRRKGKAVVRRSPAPTGQTVEVSESGEETPSATAVPSCLEKHKVKRLTT
jgi:hypothetical protein